MANIPTPTTTIPTFTQEDFKDPSLYRVNDTFKFFFGKISSLYQPGQSTALGANLSTPVFTATGQDQIPTDPNTLITLATAKALFSPANTRAASTAGSFQTGPTTVEPVQPLPGGGGSGGGGGGGGGGGATATIEEFLLAASTTVITPATTPTVGALLCVILTQDGTGQRQITWGTTIKWAGVNIDVTATTVSIFLFIGRTDPSTSSIKWSLTSTPLTGQAP